ncbi:MAG TPA: alpha/beta fold hydrolase, partial [Egibacteraceae bacterium]|nr:alpha/beta fold hydrolase [Egibacteraceae bacterium]
MPSMLRLTSLASAAAAAAAVYAVGRRPPRARETAARPVNAPTDLPPARTLAVPGRGEMFFRDAPGRSGEDVTILLLHGWIYPADVNWFTCYEALADIGRVLAPDHRGHGRGLRSPQPFRLADAADDLAGMLRELGTGPVVAVGYSMGGPLAQLLWRRHPDLVGAIVLCATSDTFALTPRDRWVWRGMGAFQV